jgi:hypothetical protein
VVELRDAFVTELAGSASSSEAMRVVAFTPPGYAEFHDPDGTIRAMEPRCAK